jgi:hypothetical protein
VEYLVADHVKMCRKRYQIALVVEALPVGHLIAVPFSIEPLLVVRTVSGNYTVNAAINWTALVVDIVVSSSTPPQLGQVGAPRGAGCIVRLPCG